MNTPKRKRYNSDSKKDNEIEDLDFVSANDDLECVDEKSDLVDLRMIEVNNENEENDDHLFIHPVSESKCAESTLEENSNRHASKDGQEDQNLSDPDVTQCNLDMHEDNDGDFGVNMLQNILLDGVLQEDMLEDSLEDNISPCDDISMNENELYEEDDFCFDDVTEDVIEDLNNKTDHDQEPLYPGSPVTIGAFMLLLAVYFTKHNITGDGIQQLLNIIALVLPQDHLLCTSLHAYKTFFKNLKNPLIYHYYCQFCLGHIDDKTQIQCQNEFCKRPSKMEETNYFLEIPIVNQIQQLFLQNGFYDSLQHRFKRNVEPMVYKDIYDGKLYRSYSHNDGPLSSPNNISFTFNTDGAAVFKSSNFSIWPIYLIINELPYNLRMRKENMILSSLWFGNQKPLMATFLKPFLETMNKLSDGIQCFAPNIGDFICKGFILCGTADLPARSLLCNSIQFNGSFSCWKCKQKGNTAQVGKGHTHVFPYYDILPKGPKRTFSSVIEDAKAVVSAKTSGNKGISSVNGVKGPSWLLFCPMFNIVDGIAIDYMHGILLGVQKLLLRLWFAPEFSNKKFSYAQHVCEVDKKLGKIRPTLDISRLPRSISAEIKYWKASEYRSFLLFYGASVLFGILDQERFSHYILLVNSMHILLKDGSTEEEICDAERMLFNFCQNFAELYHECYMTLNVHQLVHLADSVRYLGPLYTHSCFSFEDNNGFLLKMIRGTQCIDNQITTGLSFIQKLPELKQQCLAKDSREEKLYNAIMSPHLLKRRERIKDGIFILGSVKTVHMHEKEFVALSEYFGEIPTTDLFQSFNRIEINEMIIYGSSYKRMSKRDNSTISYRNVNHNRIAFGRVRSFIRVKQREICDTVAIVNKFDCVNYSLKSSILSVNVLDDEVDIVPVTNIISGCIFIGHDSSRKHGYICLFPNKVECD